MKKRLTAALFLIVLTCTLLLPVQAADGGFKDFTPVRTYVSGQFSDVQRGKWYAMYIQAAYEYGLVSGRTETLFAPSAPLKWSEAVKMGALLHSVSHTGAATFSSDAPWYQPYVDYALQADILTSVPGDTASALTRAEFAELIVKALPASAFAPISPVADNAIPDVSMEDSFAEAVYTLYRAGILTGLDAYGRFYPFKAVSRAEAAAVIARAANSGHRASFELPTSLSTEALFDKCGSAVFSLERYDSEGGLIGIGSGFFITRDGLAVTNYHVIKDAASASVTTADGLWHPVTGICGYDVERDLAILQIGGGGPYNYLSLGDSAALKEGDPVYTIGNPLQLQNTFSEGIVSRAHVLLDNYDYIQFSAPISMGSGGGPLLNDKGQVVGVACLTSNGGQQLNFAVPANDILALSRTDAVPLITIIAKNNNAVFFYSNNFPVPDYGVLMGAPIYKTKTDRTVGVKTFFYILTDIAVPEDVAVNGYIDKLTVLGFVWQKSYKNSAGYTVNVYYNESYNKTVHFGIDKVDGFECRFVSIY